MKKIKKPRILILDIETSLMEITIRQFGLAGKDYQSFEDITQDWWIHCVGYKWLGEKKVGVISTHDDKKRFAKDHTDDYNVCKKMHELMSEADLIIGHNVDKFDNKKLKFRFIKNGLEPLLLPPTVDTLKVAKREFKGTSNRLDYWAQTLAETEKEKELMRKLKNPSGLWDRCFEGSFKDTKLMAKYCKRDIDITEFVYNKLKPWMTNHPNMLKVTGQFNRKEDLKCGTCGSTNLIKNGFRRTRTGKFQRHMCDDCGSSTRGAKV